METLLLEECEEEEPNPDDDSFQSCTSSSQPAKRHRTTNRAKETGRKKQLNKKERKTIMDSISKLPLPQLAEDVKRLLLSQIGSDTSIVDIVYGRAPLLSRLLEFHRTTFIAVYHANDTGKEKYLRFQLDWYKYCSILLLPKEYPVDCIIEKPSDEMKKIRQLWTSFCEECQLSKESRNRFMILLSSAMYKTLLKHTQTSIEQHTSVSSTETITDITSSSDGDDVYFRFGGATLASMLHNRYEDIKKCTQDRHGVLAQEIKLLHIINTREKSGLPQYLKYRDRGYMYTPDVAFIPFFRAIDQCIKEVVNEKGLQDHGDQLVKVSC